MDKFEIYKKSKSELTQLEHLLQLFSNINVESVI